MAGLPIPHDWNETENGYQTLHVTVPASPLWRAIVKGALLNLTDEWRWDAATGDPATAAAQVWASFDTYRTAVDGGTP